MIYDLAVVGGGPAGLATSIFAAQSGLSVAVIEKRRRPLDKPCGEGLMPSGARLLRKMGVVLGDADYIPFIGIRYIDDEIVAEARFPTHPGWGIRRTKLIERMFDRASEHGVSLLYGARTKGWNVSDDGGIRIETEERTVQSRFLVGADGLHSKIRRSIGAERTSRGPTRYGMRRHFEVEPWSSFVEVYWADGAEAYVTPVGGREVGVAFLWGDEKTRFDELLERFPRLKKRLSGAARSSPIQGAGPFRQSVVRRYRGPVALVGDAAGYRDALTGEGLSLAFHSAQALVRALEAKRGLAAYERDYKRLSRTYYWMTGLMVAVAQRPRLRRRITETLARDPRLFDSLLAVSTNEKPLRTIGIGGLIRLVGSGVRFYGKAKAG
jgi:flavin-dependent dehydrogenase